MLSPQENYLVSWNGSDCVRKEQAHEYEADKEQYKIFNIVTGAQLIEKPTPEYSPTSDMLQNGGFPHFVFSHDDKYFCRQTEN